MKSDSPLATKGRHSLARLLLIVVAAITLGWLALAVLAAGWVLYQLVRLLLLPVNLAVGAVYAVLGGGVK